MLNFIAKAQTTTITPGKIAPDIKLMNVDDKWVSFNDYPSAKGFIVVFTCNTCPYSKAYEQRIIELNNKYTPLGFPVIAVNPNDPGASPGDSFAKMKKQAISGKYTFPYLYDDGQVITTLYGAKNTPHVFVVKKGENGSTVEYTGAIDNDTQNNNPDKIRFVEDAVSAVLKNEKPATSVTKAIGCTVRLKKN